jgi:hypothetical protein
VAISGRLHDAEANLGWFVGDVSNAWRLHSCLGYVPPIEFQEHDDSIFLRNE